MLVAACGCSWTAGGRLGALAKHQMSTLSHGLSSGRSQIRHNHLAVCPFQHGCCSVAARMHLLMPDVLQVVSLVLPQLGDLQVGNLALKELLVPQLTQFMVAVQNGLG